MHKVMAFGVDDVCVQLSNTCYDLKLCPNLTTPTIQLEVHSSFHCILLSTATTNTQQLGDLSWSQSLTISTLS